MKLSDYVIDFIVKEGVTHIFEVCGGAITHLLDSMYGRKDISCVSMHHEQVTAFAAEGYSRVSGNIGVAMATSGPGATNLVTGIASAFFDSIPCLFITGQVNTYEFKFGKPVRQVGFQETNIVDIVKPIVKDAVLITDPSKIKYYLERFIHIAKTDRPGPVLLDIPMNIQRADINPKSLESYYKGSANDSFIEFDVEIIKQIIQLIKYSLRPVVLVGGGVRLSKAQDELFKFTQKTGMPVVTSLMGKDAFPHDNQSFVGMIGTYGNRYANLTIANSDLVLALGTRLDTRQTGTKPGTFAREAKIIHVDIDPYELNNKIKVDFAINSDIKKFLATLNDSLAEYDERKILSWKRTIKGYQEKYPSYNIPVDDIIMPNFLMHKLSEILPKDAVICVDIGQNQMWAAQSMGIRKHQRFLTQGGMGAMGSSLPMAIGASFRKPGKVILVITGDGGFQLNIQELQTVYHHKLPIKIILLNNNCYGMVRQFQEQYFNSKCQSTIIGYSCPNFQDVVSAYRIPTMKISYNEEINGALKWLFLNMSPAFLEVSIDQKTQVIPKLSVNKAVEEQDPSLPYDELRKNMIVKPLSE